MVTERHPIRGFNPRPQYRGRHNQSEGKILISIISIRAPHGGDKIEFGASVCSMKFQSTPPHGGGDLILSSSLSLSSGFQSTPPHGGRLVDCCQMRYVGYKFQSTPQLRGDMAMLRFCTIPTSFNPHPIWGDGIVHDDFRVSLISIHAPARGGDMRLMLPT